MTNERGPRISFMITYDKGGFVGQGRSIEGKMVIVGPCKTRKEIIEKFCGLTEFFGSGDKEIP